MMNKKQTIEIFEVHIIREDGLKKKKRYYREGWKVENQEGDKEQSLWTDHYKTVHG